jgi:hypothetical protein
METESDEGLGHSGSSDDEKPVKQENLENVENVGEDGKRKEDLYKCRYCDRTFCYLCHLKVIYFIIIKAETSLSDKHN